MIYPKTFFPIVDEIAPICDEIFGARSKREWAIQFFFYIIKIEALYRTERTLEDRSEYRPYDFTSWTSNLTSGRITPWYNSLYMNLTNVVRATNRKPASLLPLTLSYFRYRANHAGERKRLRERVNAAARTASTPLLRAFFHELPTVYVEDQPFYAKFTHQQVKPFGPYDCRNSLGIMYANRVREGLPINFEQHGGYYGEVDDHGNYQIEYRLSDNYYTWGWQYGPKDVPYGSRRLSEFENDYRKEVATGQSGQKTVFIPAMVERYRPTIAEFMRLARASHGGQMVVRRYRYKPIYSEEMYAWFERESDNLPLHFLPDQSNTSALRQASLVILLNHPSTTFLECIYLDKPVVAHLDGSMKLDPRYAEKAAFFRQASVLHDSLSEMLDFIEQLTDIEAWWNEVREMPQYAEFKRTYCRQLPRDQEGINP